LQLRSKLSQAVACRADRYRTKARPAPQSRTFQALSRLDCEAELEFEALFDREILEGGKIRRVMSYGY
jgi:hypothetical protein